MLATLTRDSKLKILDDGRCICVIRASLTTRVVVLAEVLRKHGITSLMCSSTIDFPEECHLEGDNVHKWIEDAMTMAHAPKRITPSDGPYHSAGPWKRDLGPCDDHAIPIGNVYGDQIAEVFTSDPVGETLQEMANARLIIASPDLLKACKEMLEDLKDSHSEPDTGDGQHRYQYAIDAIRKATP